MPADAAAAGRARGRGDRFLDRRRGCRRTSATLARAGIRRRDWHAPAGPRTKRPSAAKRSARGIGVVAAPNFALGVNLFGAIVARAARADGATAATTARGCTSSITRRSGMRRRARRCAARDDARSAGLHVRRSMCRRRVPAHPGHAHGRVRRPGETITLTHTARDRATFARGALEAARWVQGRRGWYTMRTSSGSALEAHGRIASAWHRGSWHVGVWFRSRGRSSASEPGSPD